MRAGIAEDEDRRVRAREAPRGRRAVRRRRGGARVRRAAARAPARPRGRRRARPRGPVRRAGACSSSGWPSTGPSSLALRGPPVGRRRAARVHRVPAGVVARPPDLRAHARAPGAAERRPTWGAGTRSFTSLYLEPLSDEAMDALLDGLVPGLPAELRGRILDRAEGVPLYAVETVRMLLDRGLLGEDGDVYRPTGRGRRRSTCPRRSTPSSPPGSTGSTAEERRLLQDASVLGKTFTTRGARRALGHLEEATSSRCSRRSCARRCSRVQADPRSPERGQYGFLQDARPAGRLRDALRARPQGAAPRAARAYSERSLGLERGGDRRGVAAHYLEAYRTAPDADDAARDPVRAPASCWPAPPSARRRSARLGRRGAPSSRRRSSRTSRWRELFSSSWRAERPWATRSSRQPSRPCAQLGAPRADGRAARGGPRLRATRESRSADGARRAGDATDGGGVRRGVGRRARRRHGLPRGASRQEPGPSG